MTQADKRTLQRLREALRRAGIDVERGVRAAPTEAEWASLDRPPRSARLVRPRSPVPQDFLARQVLLSTVGTGLERFRRPDWLAELVEAGRPPREVFRELRRRLPRAPSETAAREAQLIVNEFARLPDAGPSVDDELGPLLQDLLESRLSTTTRVFAGPNQTGASRVFGATRARRYHRVPNRELRDRGLDGAIGSLSLAASSDAANTCVLLGRNAVGQSVRNNVTDVAQVESAKMLCMLGEGHEARSNCAIGAVRGFILFRRDAQARAFCQSLEAESLRAACRRAGEKYYEDFALD